MNDYVLAEKQRGPSSSSGKHSPVIVTFFAGLSLLLVGGLVFRKFLFGNTLLLYTDIGTDSIVAFYSDFVHLSKYIRSYGFPSWSFYVGMGQDLACLTGDLIWQPVTWLPADLIAPALVYQHLGKVLITGLLFLSFLRLRRLQLAPSLLGSLLLSFSAYMCIGSCWYWFADDVVCFTAILLGTELIIQRGQWLILAFAVALAGMITPLHLYLCAIFLAFFIPLRLFGEHGWQPRLIVRSCLTFFAVTALGLGLGAIITLPYLHVVLNSPRGSGTASVMETLRSAPVFGLESRLHYLTALLRPFANDILGTGSDFKGWVNYLEAPLVYCGLVCVVLLPHVFVNGNPRHRFIFSLFLIGILIPTLFPWFRYLFWLFQGNYYRAFSLFCILGVITLSMMVLSRYTEGYTLNLWLIAGAVIALIGILYLPFESLQSIVNPKVKPLVATLLLSYGILLTIGQVLGKQAIAVWLIVGLSVIELVNFDRITVSRRQTLKKDEVIGRAANTNDMIDALRDIRASDDELFYRIRKVAPSGSVLMFTVNDATRFGYYGTSAYRSFNNVNYTNFLTAVGAIPANSEADTHWTTGLLNEPLLSLFACEKYAFTDDPASLKAVEQYEFLKRYGNGYLFRNLQFIPFGLTFNRSIAEDVFSKLPKDEKPSALLSAVVLSDKETDQQGLTRANLSDLRTELGSFSLADAVAARRKTAFRLTSFSQTHLEGKVSLEQKSMLVLQTPFDSGWHAFQDGQAMRVTKADVGLLAVGLDAGEHTVSLSYRNPWLVPGLIITLVSLSIGVVGLWRWPRLGLP